MNGVADHESAGQIDDRIDRSDDRIDRSDDRIDDSDDRIDDSDDRIDDRRERGSEATPTGLLQLGRGGLARVVALYAILVIAVLAIPALVVQPRGTSSHLTKQEVPTAPGRAR